MTEDIKPIYGLSQYPDMDLFFCDNPIMDIAKTVGVNLLSFMNDSKDMDTCKKVAKESGVGFGTVQRARNGEINITVEKLAAIAKALNRHPAEFLINPQETQRVKLPDYGQSITGESRIIEANEPAAELYKFRVSVKRG